MLDVEKTVLVVVDVQGKLAQLMYKKRDLFRNLQRIIKGIKILGIPIIWVEQNPEGLGPTIPQVAKLLGGIQPISKRSFSCCGNRRFMETLRGTGRRQVLVVGIEAHICVYQTAVDLVEAGYEVEVVADAISSRTRDNKEVALQKMRDMGIRLTSTEMALFELLRVAEGSEFKEIIEIVK